MKIPPFELERYFAQHEFTAPHLLCSSDCESLALRELLVFEPDARSRLENLWLGYTESLGNPDLREAITDQYETVTKDEILVHAGAEEAIFNFMNVTLGPGDHVVVHWPCYQSLFQIAASIGCEVTKWEARADAGWELDIDALRKSLKKNTKAVVLNVPHNPTGYLMGKEKLAEIVGLLRRNGILLFMDEVYKGLEYDPDSALIAGCDAYENAVSLGVMSKSFGLAGLRIGWIATRNRAVYDGMARFKDYTTICNSAPSELLAALALRHRDQVLTRNRELIRTNLDLLRAFFQRHEDRFSWGEPKAGCIAFPMVKRDTADRLCANLLKQSGVLLAPGAKFGFDPRFFRVGFGRASCPEALSRFDAFLSGRSV